MLKAIKNKNKIGRRFIAHFNPMKSLPIENSRRFACITEKTVLYEIQIKFYANWNIEQMIYGCIYYNTRARFMVVLYLFFITLN